MANIYEIQDKYKMIQSLIEQGIDQDAFEDALKAIDDELSDKLENYAMVIKNIESDIFGLKSEENRLSERRKSMESNIKRMKLVMEESLLTSGQNSLKGEKFSFNVQKNPPSLFVLDENLIPRNYYESQLPKLNSKLLIESIKNGEKIEGAELRQSKSIRIR